MNPDDRLRRYADVLLDVGLNFQPGRSLAVDAHLAHAPLVRALAEGAYLRGARFVDPWYWDPHVKASRVAHAPLESLTAVPGWLHTRYRDLAAEPEGGCYVRITGDPDAGILQGADPGRAGLDLLPYVDTRNEIQTFANVEWTIGCYPNDRWAQRVFGEPDVERLWDALIRFMRLDQPDPVAVWKNRMAQLRNRCQSLQALQLARLHFEGPGTDFVVGLPPDHQWMTAELDSERGITHVVNLPTEEVATSPDPASAEGTVRATRPLVLGGTVVDNLEVTFAAGAVTRVSASQGQGLFEQHLRSDPGAARLGEVALVDVTSPIARDDRVYFDTLFDENAACHIAVGCAIPHADRRYQPQHPVSIAELGLNRSSIHTDFMVGSDEVSVTGLTGDGTEHHILRGGAWLLPEPELG